MRGLNLAVRFLLELCLLAGLAVSGWQGVGPWPVRLALAVLLPVAAATVWGRWVAPKASRRLADPARLAVEAGVFAAATVGVALVGHPWWAVALATAYVVNVSLGFAFHQREH